MARRLRFLVLVLLPGLVGCQTGPLAGIGSPLAKQQAPKSDSLVKSPLSSLPSSPVTDAQRVDVMLAAARSLETSQQYPDAVKAYEQILHLAPTNATACHRLAVVHDRNGRPDLAEPYYQKALAQSPRSASIHCDFGYSCYLRQNWGAAEHHLRKSIELQPTNRRAQNNLGMLLVRTNRQDEGLRAFATAGLSEAEAHNNVAFALSLNKRLVEAADQYARAVELDPRLQQAQRSSRELQQILTRREPPGAVLPTAFQGSPASLREAVVRLPADVQP